MTISAAKSMYTAPGLPYVAILTAFLYGIFKLLKYRKTKLIINFTFSIKNGICVREDGLAAYFEKCLAALTFINKFY